MKCLRRAVPFADPETGRGRLVGRGCGARPARADTGRHAAETEAHPPGLRARRAADSTTGTGGAATGAGASRAAEGSTASHGSIEPGSRQQRRHDREEHEDDVELLVIMAASKATEASTIPGPPRAFMATARLLEPKRVSPANLAPA